MSNAEAMFEYYYVSDPTRVGSDGREWNREHGAGHEDDPRLKLIENIESVLVRMLGIADFSEWDRDNDVEMLYRMERIQGGWQQGRGVPELPRFEPAERQERIEEILSEAVRVMQELFGIYERPVELDQGS